MKQTSFLHAAVLVCILAGGALTIWFSKGNLTVQVAVGVITSAAYVAWGIIHHAIKGDLHRKVVVEYVLMGLIAVVLLATLAI